MKQDNGSRNQEVGSRMQEIGNRKQEVRSRKQEVASRKQEVGSRKQEKPNKDFFNLIQDTSKDEKLCRKSCACRKVIPFLCTGFKCNSFQLDVGADDLFSLNILHKVFFLYAASYFLLPISYFLLPTSYFLISSSYFIHILI